MNKKDLETFKKLLTERKNELVAHVNSIREQGVAIEQDDLPDEVDLARSESDQSMNLRLRDRERVLLHKINKALTKIENGDYGQCESCGEEIGKKRLEARPVTDLCIKCKEEQEQVEKSFAE